MSQEPRAETSIPDRTYEALRPKRPVLGQIANFASRKPLGAAAGVVALLLVAVAIFAPAIQRHDPYDTDHTKLYASPSSDQLLGGDELGRDVFSRIIAGSRISLRVGLISAFVGSFIGLLIGVSSAYFGGFTDLVVQRFIDGMIAFPYIVLAIAIVAALGTSLNNVTIALAILFVPSTARIIRSQALAIKEMDYVLAARAVGASDWRIILQHLAPNTMGILIVMITFQLGIAIIAEASLSFLGLGAGVADPSWGNMLRGATKQYIGIGPWLPVFPGLAIAIVVFAWNLLGDALRDVLDPRLRGAN